MKSSTAEPVTTCPARRWFAYCLPATVLCLIAFGALTTSYGAGLSVPDWPTTFGQNMFTYPLEKWTGGVFWEHGHRVIASIVGALMLLLAVWINFSERRKFVKITAAVAFAAVMLQGVLGGITVLYGLPTYVSAAHGVLGQTFLILTVALAYFHSKEFLGRKQTTVEGTETRTAAVSQLYRISLVATAAVYLQLALGAVMRHSGAGLAVPDFPTMAGSYLPSLSDQTLATINAMLSSLGLRHVEEFQVLLHLLHRGGAIVLTIIFIYFLWKLFSYACLLPKSLMRNGALLGGLVALQITLGILTVLTRKTPVVTSLHVILGAVLLGTVFLFNLRSHAAINSQT